MVAHALITTEVSFGQPPTYGQLIADVEASLHRASAIGSGPFGGHIDAHTALTGYERFLAITGTHLRLIAAPGQHMASQRVGAAPLLVELIHRLQALALTRAPHGAWARVGDLLGAAHDLLATHVGPHGEQRSPEAELLVDPLIREAAVVRVLSLVRQGLTVRRSLLQAAASASAGMGPRAERQSRSAHLRQSTEAIVRLTDRYLAAHPRQVAMDLGALDGLTPALPRVTESPVGSLASTRQCLHVLRMISFRQASGDEQASPACLHDLARLARHCSTDPESWLPCAVTPLGWVQRANSIDALLAAHEAWLVAGGTVNRNLQGLAKAPRLYADAVHVVDESCHQSAAVRRAVLAALPRLGRDAAATVRQMARANCLAGACKPAGRSSVTWRPLAPGRTEALALLFRQAGRASHVAQISLARLEAIDPARTHETWARGDVITRAGSQRRAS